MFSNTMLALALLSASMAAADDAHVVERRDVYADAVAQGVRLRIWSMTYSERGGHIYLNEDGKGAPWAGLTLSPGGRDQPLLTLTAEWIRFGFVRFRINGLADRYGSYGTPCALQLRLFGMGQRHRRIGNRFFDGGAGLDSDPHTWQEVLIPIKHFQFDVKPGAKVTAIGLQCVGKPTRGFAVDGFSFVRFSGLRRADRERLRTRVAQPWVTWPEYDDLPDPLKADEHPPLYRDGKFVTADGRRAFLITPWQREDQRESLGVGRDGTIGPSFGLYDPKTQGFIYEQPLDGRSMSRLGFNCYAGPVHPAPFWKAVGYQGKSSRTFDDAAFGEHVRNLSVPFYVDTVCFPWTLGRPALDPRTNLPPDARHNGREHWTPYRIIGKGRDVWLSMWRTYARRYKEAGAQVIFFELMNEPAYAATTPDHRAEFIPWLKERYGTLDRVNETWGTAYKSWDEIRDFEDVKKHPGLFFDYDEYLGDRLTDLIAAGQAAVDEILPGVPAAVQTMGGYCLRPRDGVYLAKLIPCQGAVLTPTGGGRWSRHVENESPRPNTIDYGMSGAPIANDLLLAMAGDKMIVDNEMYLGPKQTRTDLRNRWWQEVLVGVDGASWFIWCKRGWAWWKGKEGIMHEADLFPYSNLIPYARRADAIRGTLEFAKEIERVREYVLPKPWGPAPRVGIIYSWSNARWRTWAPRLEDKTGDYYAAMKYLHWNLDVIPSHMASRELLGRHSLLVAGGIDHVEPELVESLSDYVKAGGTLIVGEEPMNRDLYDKPIDTEALLGVKVTGSVSGGSGPFRNVGLGDFKLIPGQIVCRAGGKEIQLLSGTQTLWTDSKGRPVVMCRRLGKGKVYYIAADLIGYPLAKLLAAIRQQEGPPVLLEITDATTGQLAPNILVSRRSYADHHALLMMNRDGFAKSIHIRIRGLSGDWYVTDPLGGHKFVGRDDDDNTARWTAARLAESGVCYTLRAENRGLLLLTRKPWSKSPLRASVACRHESPLPRPQRPSTRAFRP